MILRVKVVKNNNQTDNQSNQCDVDQSFRQTIKYQTSVMQIKTFRETFKQILLLNQCDARLGHKLSIDPTEHEMIIYIVNRQLKQELFQTNARL